MTENNTEKQVDVCINCSKSISNGNMFVVYRLAVITNVQQHYLGIQKVIEDVGTYAMKSNFHLSGSQIMLLRPDILKAFLNKKYYPERVQLWFLQEHTICLDCYEDYKKLVPLK